MPDGWTLLLTFPESGVRVGTVVRLGVALGWDVDDLWVRAPYNQVELWRRTNAIAERPPVMVLAGQEALDEWAGRPWDAPVPALPPADGDAAPLDTPLAKFDEAMAAKAEPAVEAQTVAEVMAETDLPLTRYCRQCGREFVSKKAARFHEDNHHGDPMALTCDDCGWVFTNRQGLNHHTTMKHGDASSVYPARLPAAPVTP